MPHSRSTASASSPTGAPAAPPRGRRSGRRPSGQWRHASRSRGFAERSRPRASWALWSARRADGAELSVSFLTGSDGSFSGHMTRRAVRFSLVAVLCGAVVARPLPGQRPVTRAQAVEAALAGGARAALAHARLSRRTARDADSLLAMARLRREVGDVSELDVRLAEVNAGQLESIAVDDSLAALDALLGVQLAMGLPADTPEIALADSLAPPADTVPGDPPEPLPVTAAAPTLRPAGRALTFAHRRLFAGP